MCFSHMYSLYVQDKETKLSLLTDKQWNVILRPEPSTKFYIIMDLFVI